MLRRAETLGLIRVCRCGRCQHIYPRMTCLASLDLLPSVLAKTYNTTALVCFRTKSAATEYKPQLRHTGLRGHELMAIRGARVAVGGAPCHSHEGKSWSEDIMWTICYSDNIILTPYIARHLNLVQAQNRAVAKAMWKASSCVSYHMSDSAHHDFHR